MDHDEAALRRHEGRGGGQPVAVSPRTQDVRGGAAGIGRGPHRFGPEEGRVGDDEVGEGERVR